MFVASGQIRLVGGRQGSGASSRSINNVEISVGNQQTQATHVYGWELDDSGAAPIFKVYFDGVQVGDPDGYDITAAFYATGAEGDDFYIGDAAKPPAHAENWDRWTMRVVPEPATMGLLAVGAAMMVWRRRRKDGKCI